MRDAALIWRDGRGALVLHDGDLLGDDSIHTALMLSYFTDARAEPGDDIPDGTTHARGYWGDSYRRSPLGSRLWLLSREKQLQAALEKAVAYAKEATNWLLEDKLANAIKITASSPNKGELRLVTEVTLPSGEPLPPIEFTASLLGV